MDVCRKEGPRYVDTTLVHSPSITSISYPATVQAQTCDREVVDSNLTRGYCIPMENLRAIRSESINEYQQKLGSKRAHDAMHWPCIRGLAASAGV